MLDIRAILDNVDGAADRLKARDPECNLDEIRKLDIERRRLIAESESKKAEQHRAGREVAARKQSGEDISSILEDSKALSEAIEALTIKLDSIEAELKEKIEVLPNVPLPETPVARDKSGNVTVREYGHVRKPEEWDFPFRNHIEVGEGLAPRGGLDFPRAARMTGSNWPMYRGDLACLEWALVKFLIDRAVADGRELIIPPYAVNSRSMFSSGQFPKFREQAYECRDDDLVLIPTSEVPLLNLYGGEILPGDILPLRLASFTPCFRREAGTYGLEERGLIRIHQFHKVEIFSFTRPEESREESEKMRASAEKLVEDLGLPYRTTILSTGDLAQQSAFTYDIEAWLPGQGAFSEVSSVSNCTDYQARRANIRFRPGPKAKPQFVHTLNGSALATSRIMVSILEHYQTENGGLEIPDVLRAYMNGQEFIQPIS